MIKKGVVLSGGEREFLTAKLAVESLNAELRSLRQSKQVKIKYVKLLSAIDFWFDSKFTDLLVMNKVNKVQK